MPRRKYTLSKQRPPEGVPFFPFIMPDTVAMDRLMAQAKANRVNPRHLAIYVHTVCKKRWKAKCSPREYTGLHVTYMRTLIDSEAWGRLMEYMAPYHDIDHSYKTGSRSKGYRLLPILDGEPVIWFETDPAWVEILGSRQARRQDYSGATAPKDAARPDEPWERFLDPRQGDETLHVTKARVAALEHTVESLLAISLPWEEGHTISIAMAQRDATLGDDKDDHRDLVKQRMKYLAFQIRHRSFDVPYFTGFGHRIEHDVLCVSKHFRKLLKIDGEVTNEVDLSNSQPRCLAIILDRTVQRKVQNPQHVATIPPYSCAGCSVPGTPVAVIAGTPASCTSTCSQGTVVEERSGEVEDGAGRPANISGDDKDVHVDGEEGCGASNNCGLDSKSISDLWDQLYPYEPPYYPEDLPEYLHPVLVRLGLMKAAGVDKLAGEVVDGTGTGRAASKVARRLIIPTSVMTPQDALRFLDERRRQRWSAEKDLKVEMSREAKRIACRAKGDKRKLITPERHLQRVAQYMETIRSAKRVIDRLRNVPEDQTLIISPFDVNAELNPVAVANFNLDCSNGAIYDKLCEKACITRKEAKGAFLSTELMGFTGAVSKVTAAFQELYPSLREWIQEAKQEFGYRVICEWMQKLESHLIFDHVAPRLLAELPDVHWLCIHDSFVTPIGATDQVKAITTSALDATGYHFHCESK